MPTCVQIVILSLQSVDALKKNLIGSYFYIFSIMHLSQNGCSVCPFLLVTQVWKLDLIQVRQRECD